MTRLEAIRDSLDKWIEGAKQTKKTYRWWWWDVGSKPCSMCKYFNTNESAHCISRDWSEKCPFKICRNGYCASQWNAMDAASMKCRLTFPIFHRNAVALRDRLQKLYDKEVKRAVELGAMSGVDIGIDKENTK